MSTLPTGSPSSIGIADQTGIASTVVQQHLEDSPSFDATGVASKEQVVVVAESRGIEALLNVLKSIDRRLAHLEEVTCGYNNS